MLAVGTLIATLAPGFAWLFVGRAVAGIGGAVIFGVCLAAVGDLLPGAYERNRAIGLVGTAATLGAIVGLPVLTQVVAVASWRWAMAAILAPVAVVFAGSFLLPPRVIVRDGSLGRGWLAGYRAVLGHAETAWLLAVLVVLCLVWFGWVIYFGAYAETVFAVDATLLSGLFLVGGAAEVVANNLTPLLLRRRSARVVGGAAAVVLAVDLLAVGVAYTRVWTLVPFMAIGSLASIILFTCLSILLLDSYPTGRGAVMALQSAGFEAGGALGAAGAGLALVVLDDYEAVFRLLGAVVPLLLLFLFLSARRASTAAPAESEPVVANP